jgi:hypothetical protein
MKNLMPRKELEMQSVDNQQDGDFKFLKSLPRPKAGWWANTALEPTAITRVCLRFGF